jgi:hypothetical protein
MCSFLMCRLILDMIVWLIQQSALGLVIMPYSSAGGLHHDSLLPPPMYKGEGIFVISRVLWGCPYTYRLPCVC